jgi:EAL domain-containing protein (putative c-di-GMP-specific phosphodiesterase class I)
VLNNTKLPPHSLIFEVTENTLLETLPETITTLCQLGGLGVQIAIDDYGIGGVFFYYLKQIPIHFLKIDQTFIQDVTSNNYNAILLETIITLAHKLNLKVISEGVETREQLEFLRSQGCDLAQGYYFSKPLSCEGFEQFAKSKS